MDGTIGGAQLLGGEGPLSNTTTSCSSTGRNSGRSTKKGRHGLKAGPHLPQPYESEKKASSLNSISVPSQPHPSITLGISLFDRPHRTANPSTTHDTATMADSEYVRSAALALALPPLPAASRACARRRTDDLDQPITSAIDE